MNEFKDMIIKQITVVSNQGVAIYNAGPEYEIKRFEDKSLEYPDHIREYWGYDENDKVIKVIVNCPVDVTYWNKK